MLRLTFSFHLSQSLCQKQPLPNCSQLGSHRGGLLQQLSQLCLSLCQYNCCYHLNSHWHLSYPAWELVLKSKEILVVPSVDLFNVLHLTRSYGEGQVNLSIFISTSTSRECTVGLTDYSLTPNNNCLASSTNQLLDTTINLPTTKLQNCSSISTKVCTPRLFWLGLEPNVVVNIELNNWNGKWLGGAERQGKLTSSVLQSY